MHEEYLEFLVDGWMDSPGHREAILTDQFTLTGVGIAGEEESETTWYTQHFCVGPQ